MKSVHLNSTDKNPCTKLMMNILHSVNAYSPRRQEHVQVNVQFNVTLAILCSHPHPASAQHEKLQHDVATLEMNDIMMNLSALPSFFSSLHSADVWLKEQQDSLLRLAKDPSSYLIRELNLFCAHGIKVYPTESDPALQYLKLPC